MRSILFGCSLALGVALASPAAALAHGFGERYDLPVPLAAYLAGAGAAVALSFILVGVFVGGRPTATGMRVNLLRQRFGRAFAHPAVRSAVRIMAVLVFVLYIVAGLFGSDDPDENLVPTLTWVVFWVGIAYASAFVGDVWRLINPWDALFRYAEAGYRRVTGKGLSLDEPYPERLGAWPAVVLFLAFAWIEVVYPDSGRPLNLVILVLGYTAVTITGMWWFGRAVWLRNGEAFAIVFSYLATFAPTEVRKGADEAHVESADDPETHEDADASGPQWNLRPWAVGLLDARLSSHSHAVLLVVLLATVSFDGFVETTTWTRVLIDWQSAFSFLGKNAFSGITTAGLLLAPGVFLAAFAATVALMRLLAGSGTSIAELVRVFALSLLPIALAYHVAHFFSFFAVQGQRMIALMSDPFGWGWDLFGTADYTVDVGVVGARLVWIVSVTAIVVGHAVAVYVAHVYALRAFSSRGAALRSQYPMLALMVGYTMLSLWIIAQPLTV